MIGSVPRVVGKHALPGRHELGLRVYSNPSATTMPSSMPIQCWVDRTGSAALDRAHTCIHAARCAL